LSSIAELASLDENGVGDRRTIGGGTSPTLGQSGDGLSTNGGTNWECLAWRSLLGLWFMILLWRGMRLFVGDKLGLPCTSISESSADLADGGVIERGMAEVSNEGQAEARLTIAELVFLF